MMPNDLSRLLRPRHVAVIGGGSWCKAVLEQCQKLGFGGSLSVVHPTKLHIGGVATSPSVASLPNIPDAVFIGINRQATVGVMQELAAIGAGGAVAFASGFAESDSDEAALLHSQLLTAAGDVPFLGPNCYGFINYLDRVALWPDQHGGKPVDSGVAILTQSSNIALNLTMQTRGLPIAYVITTGNQARLGFAAIAHTVLADDRVTAMGLHVEGFGDIAALEELARAAHKSNKPIVVIKAGRSDAAQQATQSHTAALAGNDAAADALMVRLGLARTHSLAEFLETLKFLHVCRKPLLCVAHADEPPAFLPVASMSCSGGEASLVADMLDKLNSSQRCRSGESLAVQLYPFTPTQQKTLVEVLGDYVSPVNPLDYHTEIWGDVEAMARVFATIAQPPFSIAMLVLDFPRSDRCSLDDWQTVMNALARTIEIHTALSDAAATARPCALAVVASLPENMPEAIAEELVDMGIVPLCGLPDALVAMERAAWLQQMQSLQQRNQYPSPLLLAPAIDAPICLDEADAKRILANAGISIPDSQLLLNVSDMQTVMSAIELPVVIKGQGIAHKTDVGAVALNIMTMDEAIKAATAMPCDRWLVEHQVTDVVAELLVSVLHDPVHGYLLTLAAGGTLAEVIDDRQHLMLPVSRNTIVKALHRLICYRLLAGYRGRALADMDAIVDAVLGVQRLVVDAPGRFSEIEINPLLCTPTQAIAADALISVAETNT